MLQDVAKYEHFSCFHSLCQWGLSQAHIWSDKADFINLLIWKFKGPENNVYSTEQGKGILLIFDFLSDGTGV